MPLAPDTLQKLIGTTGGAVGPNRQSNIMFASSNIQIAGSPSTNTLTFTAPAPGAGITFIENDATTAAIINGFLYLLGSVPQGLVTSGNSRNSIVFSILDWTTTQKGVGILATTAEVTEGVSTTKVVTPQGLNTKLGTQTAYALPVSAGSSQAINWVGPLTYGQLLIGTGTTPIPATLTSGRAITISNIPGAIEISSFSITSHDATLVVNYETDSVNIETSPVLQTDTGFAAWTGSSSLTGPYFDDSTLGSFSVTCPGMGYINGMPVSWTASSISLPLSGVTYYIYVDNTGGIGATATWTQDLYKNNVVLFECLRDSTLPTNLQWTVKENHSYNFPVNVSNYEHVIIGCVIENNLDGANVWVKGNQEIQILGSDILSDHGLTTTIPDSGGLAITWHQYYTKYPDYKWAQYCFASSFTGYYNQSGTITSLPSNKYAVQTLYASKDNLNSATPFYFSVIDGTAYDSQDAANTAIASGTTAQASAELNQLEIAQLGYLIYNGSTDQIVDVIVSKATLRQTRSTAGTDIAALVLTDTSEFHDILGPSDTNVQAALHTLDSSRPFFIADDHTTATIITNNLYLLGSLPQGLVTSGNHNNTIVFSMLDWTTTQKGVGVLATTADATAGLSATKVVTPQGLSTKLGTQTAYALPVSAGSTQALNWVGLVTYGQLLIGTGTTPFPSTLSAGSGIAITNGPGVITITGTGSGIFVEDDLTTAIFSGGNLYLLGSLPQGLVTSGNHNNTIVFSMLDWTTTQKGVGVLATTADATAGLSATKVVTPQGLSTKLGLQTAYALPVSAGSTQALNWVGLVTYGQLLIGTGTTPFPSTLSAGSGIAITNGPGVITITGTGSGIFVEDDLTTAIFSGGNLYLLGSLPQGLVTSGNHNNTIVFSMLDWTTTQKGVGVLATTADATAGLSATKVVTPQGLSTKLGLQTAYALPVSAGSTQALNWVGLVTYGQLLIGTGTTPFPSTLSAGSGIAITNAPGAITISAPGSGTFIEDDATTAVFTGGNLYLLGSLPQGLVTSGNHNNTIVFSMLDWTTTQKGVGVLATTADATAGLSATKVVTPQGLSTKLGTQTAYALPVSAGSTQALNWVGLVTYGQLLIGTGTTPFPSTLSAGSGIAITNAPGAITISAPGSGTFIEDDATTAVFTGGNLYLLGSLPQGLVTSGNHNNTIVFSMLDWTTTQKGVGVLATTADATAGLSATKVVTPQGLSTKLGLQTAYALPVSAGSTQAMNWVGPLTYGQLLIGTGTTPIAATLTAGTNISISNAPGIITIAATSGLTWSAIGGDQTLAVNNGYVCTGGALNLTLPATSAQFTQIEIVLRGGTSWKIVQGASHQIFIGTNTTTAGATGYLQSTASGDTIRLICTTANSIWTVLSAVGNIAYN